MLFHKIIRTIKKKSIQNNNFTNKFVSYNVSKSLIKWLIENKSPTNQKKQHKNQKQVLLFLIKMKKNLDPFSQKIIKDNLQRPKFNDLEQIFIQIIFKKFIKMLKGLYDLDCTTWSPQGKLFQVEYAMEAVKQGSICLGLRSNQHVVLCSLKRLPSQLAEYQQKLFKVDDFIGLVMSGLTADARVLCKYMRNQSLNFKLTYGSNQPLNRLIYKVAEKSQHKTQKASKRPYGVGLLVAGVDKDGPHLYETCPSGNYYEYYANAIGARSQSARTYLEDHMVEFRNSSLEELVLHSLAALRKSASEEGEVKSGAIQIGVVGVNQPFRLLKQAQISQYLEKLNNFKGSSEKMELQ